MIPVSRMAAAILLVAIAGCAPSYSPDTYSANAVQQANKVDKGVVVGVRPIAVSASGVVGAASGAAAGGAVGAGAAGGGLSATFGAIGGGLVGGLVGSAAEHTLADTSAYEYIVRKPNGDLVSVTQKDEKPLPVGQHVLVIAGNQARIVPDYTVDIDQPPTTTAPPPAPVAATPLAAPPTPAETTQVTPSPLLQPTP